jgi:CheY-like chemotaxis protein
MESGNGPSERPAHELPPTVGAEQTRQSLIVELVRSSVSLIVGTAWPVTAAILVVVMISHAGGFLKILNDFMVNKQSLDAEIGTTGVIFKIQQVQSGLIQQIRTQGPLTTAKLDQIGRDATVAASDLGTRTTSSSRSAAKVLWVDDHPENNIGLQYAFASLGIVVIAIDTNKNIEEAFRTVGNYDVVITDMSRDLPRDDEAGLKTIDLIRTMHPDVPVIVYAGFYSSKHKTDKLQLPVVAITNDPSEVFTLVTRIAQKRQK